MSPEFGSVAAPTEVPKTKYQKILVLFCYPVSLLQDQKVFVTGSFLGMLKQEK